MRLAKPIIKEPYVDAVIEKGDTIEIRTYSSPLGYNLVVDVNGQTVLRIGGIKREDLPTEIVHQL